MTDRKSKIGGTIGSRPCEVKLNDILIQHNDPKLTRIIMSRHQDLKTGLNRLKVLDRSFAQRMMMVFYHQIVDVFMNRRDDMPEEAFTHALCCFKALYREALKETKMAKAA